MAPSPYQKQVAAGIARLTKHFGPGWRKRVKLSRLNQGSCVDCVLGQLFTDFGTGLDTLRRRKTVSLLMRYEEVAYALARGFTVDVPWSDIDQGFADLTHEWRRQLRRLAREEI